MAYSGMNVSKAQPAPSGPPAIRPPGEGPGDVPFLFSQQQRRLPGAMLMSLLLNASLVVLAISVPHWGPTIYSTAVMMTTRSDNPNIIWLRAPGPGGGGGRGKPQPGAAAQDRNAGQGSAERSGRQTGQPPES